MEAQWERTCGQMMTGLVLKEMKPTWNRVHNFKRLPVLRATRLSALVGALKGMQLKSPSCVTYPWYRNNCVYSFRGLMMVTRVVAFAILFCSGYVWLHGQEIKWSAVRFDGTVANLNDVAFLSDGAVVAVGDHAVVRVGNPSGPFPVVTGSFSEPHLRTVSIGANDRIVCAGDKGLIGFSPTKGQDWTFLQDEDWGQIRQVAARSEERRVGKECCR